MAGCGRGKNGERCPSAAEDAQCARNVLVEASVLDEGDADIEITGDSEAATGGLSGDKLSAAAEVSQCAMCMSTRRFSRLCCCRRKSLRR